MIDVQDFDGFRLYSIDYGVGKRRKRQFPGADAVSEPADVGRNLQGTGALIDGADSRFREMGMVPVEIALDVL